jgi:hypothetical protein
MRPPQKRPKIEPHMGNGHNIGVPQMPNANENGWMPFPFPAHQIGGRNLDKKEEDEKMCRTKKASKIREKWISIK